MKTDWKTTYAGILQYASLLGAVVDLGSSVTVGPNGLIQIPPTDSPVLMWILFGVYVASGIAKAKLAADANPTPPPGADK